MGGLDVFDSGRITVDGTEMTRSDRGEMEKQRNMNFGYVFQNYYLLPEHSAAYNVYLGLHSLDLDERQKLKRVEDALRKVDMLRFRKRLAVSALRRSGEDFSASLRPSEKWPKFPPLKMISRSSSSGRNSALVTASVKSEEDLGILEDIVGKECRSKGFTLIRGAE